MKTYSAKASEVERKWHEIDADGETLGRLASRVAQLLRGKHKPQYTPSLDTGDFVIVVNAAKIRITGRKLSQKMYYHHSLYHGGLKAVNLERLLETQPTRAVEHAVKGMLPHTRLGDAMLKKLKVYAGPTHPHASQVRYQTKQETPVVETPSSVPSEEA